MINPPPKTESDWEDASLDSCDALLIGLGTRRFVVVRPDEPQKDLWPIDGGWEKIRQLCPGDRVIYKGIATKVIAVDVYR